MTTRRYKNTLNWIKRNLLFYFCYTFKCDARIEFLQDTGNESSITMIPSAALDAIETRAIYFRDFLKYGC